MKRFLTAFGTALTLVILINSCSITYKFDGASVDYNLIKTISIQDFPNHAMKVNPDLSFQFSDALRNKFIRQTRLRIVENNADLEIEGEITGYDQRESGVRVDNAFNAMAELVVTVRVRYVNNKRPADDLDQSFTSAKSFPNDRFLDDVLPELLPQIIDDLVDQIYNATLGNW